MMEIFILMMELEFTRWLYLEAVKNGFYDSPTSVHIYVRNNKIVEVRAVYP